jgi:hypothetical protein
MILAEVPAQLSARGDGEPLAAVPTHLLGESGCTLRTSLPPGTESFAVLTLELDGSLVSIPAKIIKVYKQNGMTLTVVGFFEVDPVSAKVLGQFVRRRLPADDQFQNL